jgi:hypothetical protein
MPRLEPVTTAIFPRSVAIVSSGMTRRLASVPRIMPPKSRKVQGGAETVSAVNKSRRGEDAAYASSRSATRFERRAGTPTRFPTQLE